MFVLSLAVCDETPLWTWFVYCGAYWCFLSKTFFVCLIILHETKSDNLYSQKKMCRNETDGDRHTEQYSRTMQKRTLRHKKREKHAVQKS